MKLCVVYTVSVFAYVDTETERVTRVVTDDENVQLARPAIVEYDNGATVIDPELKTKAIEISQNSLDGWPGWEHGF